MASVRRATAADLDTLVAMARDLHAESPEYRDEPFEPFIVRQWLFQRMGGLVVGDTTVLVAEAQGLITGALVAVVVPRWFNRHRIAAELTVYVRPEHRGGRALPLLVRAFKAWAKGQGATRATLGVSTGIHPERTVRAYGKLGFRLDGYTATTNL